MADLSQYVNFSVQLDKSGDTPVIVLTDTSNYPTGVAATITGVFSATQPDGLTVQGSFNTPDVTGVFTTKATASITINDVGTGGRNLSVTFNDGTAIRTFTYTKQAGDTNTNILAANIAAAWNGINGGYTVTSGGNVVLLQAPDNVGTALNGVTPTVSGNTTAEIPAKAYIGGAFLVSIGTVFLTKVDDPVLGLITIGTYTQQAGDTTDIILMNNIIADILAEGSGYTGIQYLSTSSFYIIAKPGLGASINGHDGRLTHGGSSTFNNFAGGADATAPLNATATSFQGGGFTSGNNHANKELRLATDGNFQKGLYVLTETVKATGYNDTVKIKTFILAYDAPVVKIDNITDVFAPSVQVIDTTDYNKTGYTKSVVYSWSADIQNVGSTLQTATSTAALFDIVFNGNYYDAHYHIYFQSIVTYAGTVNTWVSLIDILTDEFQLDAYSPPVITDLANSLFLMRQQIQDGTYCGGCGCKSYEQYEKANSLYNTFVENGKNGINTTGLYSFVLQLQKIFNCSGILNQTHTNNALMPYDWGTSTGTSSQDIQFKVGSGKLYAPNEGDTTYYNPLLAKYKPRLVYSASIADYLDETDDYTAIPGGFALAHDTFHNNDKYTVVYAGIGAGNQQQFTNDQYNQIIAFLGINSTQ